MRRDNIENLNSVARLAMQAMSPRARWLDKLDRYVEGTQYQGRQNFWTGTVPLQERAPCIVYNVTKSAIRSFKTALLGEGRFPDITSKMGWDTDQESLSEEDGKAIDRSLAAIASQVRLQSGCGEVLAQALGSGTSVTIYGIRNKKLFMDNVKAGWCIPVFKSNTNTVESLVIEYPYIDTSLKVNGRWKARAMMYRRTIDEKQDIIFHPVEFTQVDQELKWVVDTKVSHGLGFCPVHWYALEKGCNIKGRIDGHAIQENLLEEIDELNTLLSVKHRAALLSEGQWVEIGVEEGYNPTDPGRAPNVIVPSTPLGGEPAPTNIPNGGYAQPSRQGGKRRRGLLEIWQYQGLKTNVDVKLIALPGDALKNMAEAAQDERNKLSELLGVVFLETENLPKGAAMSGTALLNLRKRFIERCDELRCDFGDNFIVPVYGMLLRIATTVGLNIPGLDEAKAAVERLQDVWSWESPPFELSWGFYEEHDPNEQLAMAQMVEILMTQNLLTPYMAVKMLRSQMGVEDIDAYLKLLEAHNVEKQAQEQAKADDEHGKQVELQGQKLNAQVKMKAKSKPS